MSRIYYHDCGAVMNALKDANSDEAGVRIHAIKVEAGQSAWNPASMHNTIHGPCEVTYWLYPDGGVDATVRYRS